MFSEEITLNVARSGINTISAKQVKVKIEELLTEYKKLRKSMGKQTIAAVATRSNFQEKLQVCFDILAPDAKDHIEKDKLRTKAAKDAELSLLRTKFLEQGNFAFPRLTKPILPELRSVRLERLRARRGF